MSTSDELMKKYEEQAQASAESYDKASDSKRGKMIEHPGVYAMKVPAIAYFKNGELRKSPDLKDAKTGTTQYNFSFQATRPVGKVSEGDFIFASISLWPAKDASDEKKDNIAKFSKPVLKALTGESDVTPTFSWVKENLLLDVEVVDDKINIKKPHSFDEREFLVEVVEEVNKNTGATSLKVNPNSVTLFRAGDESRLRMEEISEENGDISSDSNVSIPVNETSSESIKTEPQDDDLPF